MSLLKHWKRLHRKSGKHPSSKYFDRGNRCLATSDDRSLSKEGETVVTSL
jgi:hypothetical protein